MIQSTLQALLHQATVLALRVLPDEKRVPLERRMRGRYDAQRLARADVCVISYGKSGRTWARVNRFRNATLPSDSIIGLR